MADVDTDSSEDSDEYKGGTHEAVASRQKRRASVCAGAC